MELTRIEATVRKALSEWLNIEPESIVLDKRIIDQGRDTDSLDVVEILIETEEVLGVEIDDGRMEPLTFLTPQRLITGIMEAFELKEANGHGPSVVV